MTIQNISGITDTRQRIPLSLKDKSDSPVKITDTFQKSEVSTEPEVDIKKKAGRLRDISDFLGMASFFGSPVAFFALLAATNNPPFGALGALVLTGAGCLAAFKIGEHAENMVKKS